MICDNCIHKEVCEWVPNFDADCSDYLKERPQGEWIKRRNEHFRCNNCNQYSNLPFNFCPNCGADMRKE